MDTKRFKVTNHFATLNKLQVLTWNRIYAVGRQSGRVGNRSRARTNRIVGEAWIGAKVLTQAGWAYLVVVNDWFTKKILGAFVGSRSRAAEWLEAINKAVNRQFPQGIREAENLELNLMSDNGSQPTSLTFIAGVPRALHQASVHGVCQSEGQCRYRTPYWHY